MDELPQPGPKSRAMLGGGCACGALRYRLEREPMFVHCCHCTRCQRETGGPFAHHAMIEFTAMTLLQGEAEFVKVPTDSGNTHWVARCPPRAHIFVRSRQPWLRLPPEAPAFDAYYDAARLCPEESLALYAAARAAKAAAARRPARSRG